MLFINVEIFTRSVKNNDKRERLVRNPKEASLKAPEQESSTQSGKLGVQDKETWFINHCRRYTG